MKIVLMALILTLGISAFAEEVCTVRVFGSGAHVSCDGEQATNISLGFKENLIETMSAVMKRYLDNNYELLICTEQSKNSSVICTFKKKPEA